MLPMDARWDESMEGPFSTFWVGDKQLEGLTFGSSESLLTSADLGSLCVEQAKRKRIHDVGELLTFTVGTQEKNVRLMYRWRCPTRLKPGPS
jgi:hypothetical protein